MHPRYKYRTKNGIKELLDQKFLQYNAPKFILDDPISIPHQFTKKQDIEITGFLAASISWGNRKSIVSNAGKLIRMMDGSPYDFLMQVETEDFIRFLRFVHRTFNGEDCLFFLTSLRHIYKQYDSLEPLFSTMNEFGVSHAISRFRRSFLETEHQARSEKHISDPLSGSASKRLNMFLRWMVRRDDHGVDFGLWRSIDPATLICPLDIHVGRVARALGLLQRRQNDWKAALELTENLRTFDPDDPVKYDFALFGMGLYGW